MSAMSESSHGWRLATDTWTSAEDRHTSAVANSVALAHQAAACGDLEEALSWVSVLRAIGELPKDLERLSVEWLVSSPAAGDPV